MEGITECKANDWDSLKPSQKKHVEWSRAYAKSQAERIAREDAMRGNEMPAEEFLAGLEKGLREISEQLKADEQQSNDEFIKDRRFNNFPILGPDCITVARTKIGRAHV